MKVNFENRTLKDLIMIKGNLEHFIALYESSTLDEMDSKKLILAYDDLKEVNKLIKIKKDK